MSDKTIIITTEGTLPRPRFLRRWRAFLFGWFWLPCPLCGEMFAGFERGEVAVPYRTDILRGEKMACQRHRYGG